MLKLIKAIQSIHAAQHKNAPYPPSRNLIVDVVKEGRRKNIIHEIFDADITDFMELKTKAAEEGDKLCSVTAFVSFCLAKSVGEQMEMQAYRSTFGSSLVIFDDVDVVFTIEKMVDAEAFPWTHTIRACNQKSAVEIDKVLKDVKTESIKNTQKWRMAAWLMKQPRFIRWLLWLLPRHSPFFMKYVIGTVGVTSVGMLSRGNLALVPITPLTLTLAIGSIDDKPVYENGEITNRQFITLCLCADHDVIDGAPLTRFASRLRTKIADPKRIFELQSSSENVS